MDSDDDGAYGYDVPEDAGIGFRLGGSKPSHLPTGNDDSSADDAHGNSSDDNDHFAYGAHAARKRRRREQKSGTTDKERNLYGVFYEDSSDDEERRGRGGGGGSGRSRHYDKSKHRQAGLAFVKASESAAPVEGERTEGKGGDDQVKSQVEDTPGWLADKPRAKSDKLSNEHADGADMDMDIDEEDEEDEHDAMDEDELKLMGDQEKRLQELLAVATTSKNPLTFAKPGKASAGKVDLPDAAATQVDGGEGMFQDGASGHGLGFGDRDQSDRVQESRPPAATAGIGFTPGGDDGGAGLGMSGQGGLGHQPGLGLGGAGLGMSARGGLGHQPGLGLGSAREPSRTDQRQGGLGLGMGMGGGMGGLGSSNNFPSFAPGGMGGLGLGGSSQPPKKKDPNLGKWEKHTKGIGMKLLQKMGYEGSGGLGAKRRRAAVGSAAPGMDGKDKRDETAGSEAKEKAEGTIKKGISRPVEVVVRPNGLGLGFGSFKEQSQLKVNRQIEAEVRGLELPKEEKKKKDGKSVEGIFGGIDKSLLPSTESLINRGAKSWRKGKANKKPKRKIVNYQDLLDQSAAGEGEGKVKIIDMRGAPSVSTDGKDSATATATVPIGEELLHNVTLLLNTHEGQLRTSSYMVKSTEQKIASLEAECQEMVDRKEGIQERKRKMELAMGVIGQAEKLIDKMACMRKDPKMDDNDRLDFAMSSLQGIFVDLYSKFSREERKSLKFDATLVPSIVNPLLESLTSNLNPLKMDLSWMDHLASGTKTLCGTVGSDDEAYALREMVFLQSIVPWVQRSLGSSKWDPALSVETGIRLYEALLKSAYASFPDAEQEENDILKENITAEVVQKTVLPKLLRAVSNWKAKFDTTEQIANPLHLWILPWLPYVDDDTTLGTLLDEVRRNLKKTLSFLGKSVPDDVQFMRSCIATLSPWKRLFKEGIFELTSSSITPRFARSLARVKICIVPAEQDWSHLRALFEFFEEGLMSRDDFICLVEGEVLSAWADALYCALKQKEHDMNDFKDFFIEWKRLFFFQTMATPGKTPSAQLLRSDAMVCRYFFGGLKMIEAMVESNEILLDSLAPSHPADCNYRICLLRRSKEDGGPHRDRPSALNVKVRQKERVGRVEASFRDIVEEFAHQHDISFRPKGNSMKDGKPVFMFGNHPVYIDKNLLFALRGSAWQPISLEHLAQSC